MLTQDQALDAIKEGVKRARCYLSGYEFKGENGENIEIRVKAKETDEVAQVGLEYSWSNLSAEQLSTRVRRFSQHFVQKKSYHMYNPLLSIE